MKNLRVSLAVVALLAGSASAVLTSTNANASIKKPIDGYYRVNPTGPITKFPGATNLGTNLALITPRCPAPTTPQCVAEFNTDGSLVPSTLIPGTFN